VSIFGIAASERNMGLLYEQQGRINEARELIQSAHEAFAALDSPEAQKTGQDLQRLSGRDRGSWLRRVWKSLER